MKRTARWTTAIAAAALIGVPAAGWSQTPPAAASQPPTAQQPADAKAGSPAEHIRLAEAALNDIPASTLPASAKSRVADLKRQLNALEKSAAPSPAKKNTWAKDVASIDKTLNELLGPATAGAAGAPSATAGTTGTTSKTAPLTLDDTTKAKLMEVRQHVTAFAASMSSAGSSGPAPSSEPSPESAAAAAAQAPTANPAPAPTAESTPPAGASTPAASAQPPAASPAQPAEESQAQAPTAAAAGAQVDEEAAKRHLTAARDSLAQLTQMPAAAQLTGETRTQVSQLISNFNELITAKADWKAAYDKVTANVTTLIGANAAPEAAAAAPSGTPGAVGTSGNTSATLDPGIRGKLVEFREHLVAFEKAAATGSSGAPDSSAPMASSPAAGPSASAPASSPSSSSASPSASSSSPSSEPAASSAPAGQSSAQSPSAGQASQDSAISHIAAIESLIVGSGSKLTLEPAQVEQIRMHLAELRKAIEKR